MLLYFHSDEKWRHRIVCVCVYFPAAPQSRATLVKDSSDAGVPVDVYSDVESN